MALVCRPPHPTLAPTKAPTRAPTQQPTLGPTQQPTKSPTKAPTLSPTTAPTQAPTQQPTLSPTPPCEWLEVIGSDLAGFYKQVEADDTGRYAWKARDFTATLQWYQGVLGDQWIIQANVNEHGQQGTLLSHDDVARFPPTELKEHAWEVERTREHVDVVLVCRSPDPTLEPTKAPTQSPTQQPTLGPTQQPTLNPTQQPTKSPTKAPTQQPTKPPTKAPTQQPTLSPTLTTDCTWLEVIGSDLAGFYRIGEADDTGRYAWYARDFTATLRWYEGVLGDQWVIQGRVNEHGQQGTLLSRDDARDPPTQLSEHDWEVERTTV